MSNAESMMNYTGIIIGLITLEKVVILKKAVTLFVTA